MTKVTYIVTNKRIVSGTIAGENAHPEDISRMVCSNIYKEDKSAQRLLEIDKVYHEGYLNTK